MRKGADGKSIICSEIYCSWAKDDATGKTPTDDGAWKLFPPNEIGTSADENIPWLKKACETGMI